MDPLTAALTLANSVVKLITLTIESQPPELRAEIAKQQWQDFMTFRSWIDKLMPKG